MSIKQFLIFSFLFIYTFQIHKGELYDAGRSGLINLNPMNFDTQITNNRNKEMIAFVHFYSPDDGKSEQLKNLFIELDKEYGGMFKLAGLNCKMYSELCAKQNVKDYPSYMIYPPLPAPVMKYEGKLEPKYVLSYLGKFIDNKCQELSNNNFDDFISQHPNLPKILLFTDKKNIPLIFKRLSLEFNKKIEFGIVRNDMTAILSKYKVNKFPSIMAIGVDKKTKFYEGNMKYKPIFDFCNVYQETFFVVGDDTTPRDEPKKPWLNEKLPELTKESGNDLCFAVDKVICVVCINKEKPDKKIEDTLIEIQNWLSPKINRGSKYKFGWINSSTQKAIIKEMGIEENSGPIIVLINRGARKRYHKYEGEINVDGLRNLFEKLASGDVRFKAFKGNTIPELDN